MLRATPLATLIACAASAAAADLPKDITPEASAAFIKTHARLAAEEKAAQLKSLDEAKTMLKFPATEKEGRRKIGVLTARLETLEKAPWRAKGNVLVVIGEHPKLEAGMIGIVSPLGEYVASQTPDGVLVDGLINPTTEKLLVKFLIASPFPIPKALPKGKKSPPLFSATDLWYVAGFITTSGKEVPVLYSFKVTKDDFTEPK